MSLGLNLFYSYFICTWGPPLFKFMIFWYMQKPLPNGLVNLFSFWTQVYLGLDLWLFDKSLPTDQVILSNVILRPDRQLCSLPKRNGLWTRWKGTKHFILIFWCSTPFCALKKPQYLFSRLKIAPHAFNDAGLCFHGDLMNCNRYTCHTCLMQCIKMLSAAKGGPSCDMKSFNVTFRGLYSSLLREKPPFKKLNF